MLITPIDVKSNTAYYVIYSAANSYTVPLKMENFYN